jgi:hypothetical protein
MLWTITLYNGTVWKAPRQMELVEALELFKKDTKATDWDIKSIVNEH